MPGSCGIPSGFWDKNNHKTGLKTVFCAEMGVFTNFNCSSCAIFAERGCRWQSCRAILAERARRYRDNEAGRNVPGRKFSKTDNLRGEVINILVHFSTV